MRFWNALRLVLFALLFSAWSHGSAPAFSTWNIIVVGDSHSCAQSDCTAGFGVPETYFDLYTRNTSPAVFAHTNLAVAGTTPAQICTVAAAQTPVGGKKNIMVFFSIGNGQNDPAAFTAIISPCLDAARSAGWYVVAVTLPSQTGKSVSFCDPASATIRGWIGTHADAVVDPNSDPLLGCDNCFQNLTYFQSDGVHFTQVGENRNNAVLFTPILNAIR